MAKKKVVKKPVVTKTQLIKEALKKDKNASPKEIAERLKGAGVTPQYVSTVKFNMGKKNAKSGSGKTGAGKRTTRSGNKNEQAFTMSELVKASDLAEDLGGVERAQEILDAISRIS